MKLFKFLLSLVLIIGLSGVSHAQFFKKLKKRAEHAVERTVLNKTDREVSKTTDQTIDGVIKGDGKNQNNEGKDSKELSDEEKEAAGKKISSMFGGGLEGVPDNYTFSYTVTYQMTTNKDQIPFEYLLQPDAAYFGNKMPDSRANSTIVYDLKKNIMVTFMDDGSQKMAMKMKMPNMKKVQQKYGDKLFPEKGGDQIQIIPIEGKKILGYECLGYKVISKDGEGKMWFTNDAPVSLNGVFANFKTLPKTGPYANMPINETSLIMEMEFQSSKKRKDNMHMICTDLKKQTLVIEKKDYKSGM